MIYRSDIINAICKALGVGRWALGVGRENLLEIITFVKRDFTGKKRSTNIVTLDSTSNNIYIF